MSWLPSLASATEALSKIGGELGELSHKVQGALPIDGDLINKLTLRSDELVHEHELLDAQEKRKELVREYLSEILPWETKDESRAILVDRCKEAILTLSKEKSTFETPFALEKGEIFNVTYNQDEQEEQNDEKDGLKSSEIEAIEASASKLEKMQPLPVLLEYFDIDTHVGLIERLMKIDGQLVMMHSNLSGAGEKETIFWKNYFFHCAFTRYEQGLSVDEIWSQKPKAIITDEMTSVAEKANEASLQDIVDDESSVELEFEPEQQDTSINRNNQSQPPFDSPVDDCATHGAGNSTQSDSTGSGTSYEIVNEAMVNIEDNDSEDLDDLEAEIARELGDD